MKVSLVLLAVVAVCAVIWIIFFLDGDRTDFFTSDRLSEEEVKTTQVEIAPDEVAETIIPTFDIVRISRNGTGVIAGRAEPNSDVYVYAWDRQIGAAVADRNGEWVLIFDDPLPSGPTELSLKSQMPGHFDIYSSDVVIVAVPERDEQRFIDDETEGVVAILSPRAGHGPSKVLQKPARVNLGDMTKGLGLDSLDYDDAGKVMISGTSAPGSSVRVYLDNGYLGEVTGDEDGNWTLTFNHHLGPGEHVLRLDQLLEGDDVEVRIEQPFDPALKMDPNRAKGEIVVRPGNSLWHIARKLYGSGFHYTLIFGANRDIIRDPDLIYPGQKFTLPQKPEQEEATAGS
ncbi:LysM peptidoglycan-binding domain-containing protein [Luteithermobacter gelatinilyticus]|uniref:LysM peptidoglycan-binding domain-containing protein n=1 Tax=Luteithermobacter gelatinilyticus TaxID=2582913 RepID=UPI001106D8F6|nr:LysM peptidoglycan-binding domain-containing protein [Luteithermobacter gelatinilyticus]